MPTHITGDTLETGSKATPFTFLNMVTAKWTTQLLSAAAELGVADTLKEGPLSAEEIASRTQADVPMMYRLLRALSALGVLEALEGRRFQLTDLGQYLRSDIPGSMRALAMMTGRPWHNRGWEQLAHCVRTGAPGGVQAAFGTNLWDYFDKNRADFDNFNEAMTGASASMHGTATEAYDFSRFKTLADIGGGHGRLLGTIIQRTPGLSGILFDRPSLKEGAEAELRKMGLSQRCRFVGGDFFTSVPTGADAYMMSHILHDWPDDRALTILRNCREAMKPGGTFLAFDAVIKPGIDHDWGALMDLEIFMMFGGRDRTEEEFSQLYRKAGFKLTRVVPTRSSVSIVEGVAV
jgi:SAM-dependent methyltransferase